MKVESVPIEQLLFDPANTNTHDNKNLDSIQGSLSTFGQVEALIVNSRNNIVVGGNGRLAAMKAMKWTSVAVHFMDLTPAQHAMLSITLNRTSELSKRDPGKLAKTLMAMRDEDFDLKALGWDDLDMSKVLGEETPREEDEKEQYKSMFEVVVECYDEAEQQEVYERLQEEGLKCRVLSM